VVRLRTFFTFFLRFRGLFLEGTSMAGSVQVGLVGLGTIGVGVARLLLEKRSKVFAGDCGPITLKRIADKDLSDRGIDLPSGILTEDVRAVLEDPEIGIIVELVGGIEPARTFVLTAIEHGKHVVTANKALLSAHGEEIFRAAQKRGVDVLFEAAVGGSIPIIRALRESLGTSAIRSIYGILNGTTNYILTRMTDDGASYDEMLKAAQQLGFAERNPVADVSGKDSLQKLVILARLAFGASLSPEEILCEGIERITPMDISFAQELGYRIKLLAIAKEREGRIEARVHPAMIPLSGLMANVKFEYNAIEVVGEEFGTQVFYGKGAGQRPTATVVVSDVIDLASRIQSGAPTCRVAPLLASASSVRLVTAEDLFLRHYVRLEVFDRAGVLADIARLFAEENISIESVIQKGRAASDTVPLVIMTHEASEASIERALRRLSTLNVVRGPIQRIRVEELE